MKLKSLVGTRETNSNISKMIATLLNKTTAKQDNQRDPRPFICGKYYPKKGGSKKGDDPMDQKPEGHSYEHVTCVGKRGTLTRCVLNGCIV